MMYIQHINSLRKVLKRFERVCKEFERGLLRVLKRFTKGLEIKGFKKVCKGH